MEKHARVFAEAGLLESSVGYGFYPTDEEIISHYLAKKVADANFSAVDIGVIDMSRVEPWEMANMGKKGENKMYFFCVWDKKYPTGPRTNRATAKGFWKATGIDKEIFKGKCLIGMKKTLVFYKDRAPKGVRTNWICKEFRLVGTSTSDKPGQDDWVIVKIYEKDGGKEEMIPSPPSPPPSLIESTISTTPTAAEQGVDGMDCSEMVNYSELLQFDAFPNGYFDVQTPPNYPYQCNNFVEEEGINGYFLGDFWVDMKTEDQIILRSGSQETNLITSDVNTDKSSLMPNLDLGWEDILDQLNGEMDGSDDTWI